MLGQIGKLCRTLGRLQEALDAQRKAIADEDLAAVQQILAAPDAQPNP